MAEARELPVANRPAARATAAVASVKPVVTALFSASYAMREPKKEPRTRPPRGAPSIRLGWGTDAGTANNTNPYSEVYTQRHNGREKLARRTERWRSQRAAASEALFRATQVIVHGCLSLRVPLGSEPVYAA
jgi:hypothetical protein